MAAGDRVRAIRLMEKIERNSEYARRVGLKVENTRRKPKEKTERESLAEWKS